MNNSWLYFRRRLLQTLQFRHFSSLSWFQNHNYALSSEAEVVLENEASRWHFRIPCGASTDRQPLLLDGNISSSLPDNNDLQHDVFYKNGKFDITSIITSLGARNQELMNSLSKIIEPLDSKDTIHVGKNTKGAQKCDSLHKRTSQISVFRSFDLFSSTDPLLGNVGIDQAIAAKHVDQDKGIASNSSATEEKTSDGKDKRKGPTLDQLEKVRAYYLDVVPDFHRKGEDFTANIHSHDIVFENHFFKKTRIARGMKKYRIELALYRILGSFAYPSYHFEIHSISTEPTEGQVRMHWRMYYVSNWQFFRRLLTLIKDMKGKKKGHDFKDAISTFSVNKDGKIFYHKVDRLLPVLDEEESPVNKMKAKTAKIVGLAPKAPYNRPLKDTE